MVELLLSLLVLAAIVYIIILILGMFPVSSQIKTIVYVIILLVVFLLIMSWLGYSPNLRL